MANSKKNKSSSKHSKKTSKVAKAKQPVKKVEILQPVKGANGGTSVLNDLAYIRTVILKNIEAECTAARHILHDVEPKYRQELRVAKASKNKTEARMCHPCDITPAVAKMLGYKKNDKIIHNMVVADFNDYAAKKNLKDPNFNKAILPNKEMIKAFDLKHHVKALYEKREKTHNARIKAAKAGGPEYKNQEQTQLEVDYCKKNAKKMPIMFSDVTSLVRNFVKTDTTREKFRVLTNSGKKAEAERAAAAESSAKAAKPAKKAKKAKQVVEEPEEPEESGSESESDDDDSDFSDDSDE